MTQNAHRPEVARRHRVRASLAGHGASEAGQAMLELAIVLPVLLLILFSIIEFGFVLGRYQVVVNASREAARTASLYRQPCDPEKLTTETNESVTQFSGTLGMTLPPPQIVSDPGDLCESRRFEVTVTFDHPISLLSAVFKDGTIPLSSTTTMLNERRIP
jgi:hypothetical protein